jgi:hypothetical protein
MGTVLDVAIRPATFSSRIVALVEECVQSSDSRRLLEISRGFTHSVPAGLNFTAAIPENSHRRARSCRTAECRGW